MKLSDLDELLAEASRISNHRHFVLVGSLSVLGAVINPPEEMVMSVDADIFTKFDPGRVFEEIATQLGENSQFNKEHGVYADPINPAMLSLPSNWESRLLQIPLPSGAVVWCLDPNDAASSKLIRGEDRDCRWVISGLTHGILDATKIRERLESTDNVLDHSEITRAQNLLDHVLMLANPNAPPGQDKCRN